MGTSIVTVNPLANSGTITGANSVCVGSEIYWTHSVAGGSWSRTNTDANYISGLSSVVGVIGNHAGIDTLFYTVTNICNSSIASKIVTVNPAPSLIGGSLDMCITGTASLSDSIAGGTWSSSNTAVASVGSNTGVLSAHATGTTTISYVLTDGCRVFAVATIDQTPSAGAISGAASLCSGVSASFTDADPGGTWSSSSANASVGSITGQVTGTSTGTGIISYTVTNACGTAFATATVTINPSPAPITGGANVCTSLTTVLANAVTGGTWSSGSPGTATVSGGTVSGVTPGIATISYTLPGGCSSTLAVTVSLSPADDAITGSAVICLGYTNTLTDGIPGGTWSCSNGNATVNPSTGIVTGHIIGMDTVFYTATNVCGTTHTSEIVNINPSPLPITGVNHVCPGNHVFLSDGAIGGLWNSSNIAIASVAPGTGEVLGVASGTVTISYVLYTGCSAEKSFTVNVCGPIEVKSTEPDEVGINIFPNPNNGSFTITGNLGVMNDDEVQLDITDIPGRMIYEAKVAARDGKIDQVITPGKQLASGIYLLRISGGSGSKVLRFVVE